MSNEELIETVRREREEEVRFFSNAAKPERERWVVLEFLRRLSVSVSEAELTSPKQADNVDVIFRDAKFQVKELTEANCRRSSEVRTALKRAETATEPKELLETPLARDIVWVDAFPIIRGFALDGRYSKESRGKLDLLIYVTRHHAFLDQAMQPADLSVLGWRSISCLYGRHAYVLVAATDAPLFLRAQYRVTRAR